MLVQMSAPNDHLTEEDKAAIEKELAKLERRLNNFKDVRAELRVAGKGGHPDQHVTLELRYGRNHLVATAHHYDTRLAVHKATHELIRQINDRSRGGHSSLVKAGRSNSSTLKSETKI